MKKENETRLEDLMINIKHLTDCLRIILSMNIYYVYIALTATSESLYYNWLF